LDNSEGSLVDEADHPSRKSAGEETGRLEVPDGVELPGEEDVGSPGRKGKSEEVSVEGTTHPPQCPAPRRSRAPFTESMPQNAVLGNLGRGPDPCPCLEFVVGEFNECSH